MANNRTCSVCHTVLPDKVPEVYCPACALRGAMDQDRLQVRVRGQFEKGWGWLCERTQAWLHHTPNKPSAPSRSNIPRMMKPSQPLLQPGEILGDYEILDQVGGNMGLVYKARHRRLGKVVALKLLPGDWTKDAERVARFQREIQVMGRLDHPNLVRAMDARNIDGIQLVAMEWVDGTDLHQIMKTRSRIPISDACEMARQAALGLQHAHEHGLIHRDIKPSNLMLARPGVLKIIDLGLALSQDESTHSLTQTGVLMGTMSFCAPEQIRNPSKVDIRADVYSLGCTLYKLLSGKPPYGSKQSVSEIVHAHLEEPFPLLCQARPDAPAELEAILLRMTQKDPGSRYATPKEVADALAPFSRGADLSSFIAAQDPEVASNGKAENPSPREASVTKSSNPSASRFRRWMPAMAALILALIFFAFLKRSPSTNTSLEASSRAPVVVLMDTTAPRGIYGKKNKDQGRSNAMDLYDIFKHRIREIPPENIIPEPVGLNWENRSRVRLLSPEVILIHRSVFFHPMAAALGIPYREDWKSEQDQQRFETAYKLLGDRVLREFIGDIGNSNPRTKFVIYSRGTDTNWLSTTFRTTWTKELEGDYPALKNRIHTLLIDGSMTATLDDPPTNREKIIGLVRELLALPPQR